MENEKETKWVDIKEVNQVPQFKDMWGATDDRKEVIGGLVKSMSTHGFDTAHPIILWDRKGRYVVIDGHTRYAAAKKAELTEVYAQIVTFESVRDAYAYAVGVQYWRRDKTDPMIMDAISVYDKRATPGIKKDKEENIERSSQVTAELLGIPHNKVVSARILLDSDDKRYLANVRKGKWSIAQAVAFLRKRKLAKKRMANNKAATLKPGDYPLEAAIDNTVEKLDEVLSYLRFAESKGIKSKDILVKSKKVQTKLKSIYKLFGVVK